MGKIPLGSVEKYSIEMEPIGASSLSSSSWKLKVWARKSIIINKEDTIKETDNRFVFFVDTSLIGKGQIKMQLLLDLIDVDYKHRTRPQLSIWDTGDIVVDM